MDARRLVNAVGDWVFQRTAKQVIVTLLLTSVTFIGARGWSAWRNRDAALLERGRQEQRDSIAAQAVVRLRHVRDSVHATATAIAAENRRLAQQVDRARVAWSARPRDTVPLVVVRGDTINLPGDSVGHVVDHPIAQWIVGASQVLMQQDSLLRRADEFFTTILPAYRKSTDSTIAAKDHEIFITDSLATVRVEAITADYNALKRQGKQSPGLVRRAVTWTVRAGALCAAYSLGARKPCWRVVVP